MASKISFDWVRQNLRDQCSGAIILALQGVNIEEFLEGQPSDQVTRNTETLKIPVPYWL